jgi:hypothetical protein
VSAFKGKFGGKATPIIQGCLFLKADYAERCVGSAAEHMALTGTRQVSPPPPDRSLGAETVAHHLRLFGVPGASADPADAWLLVADAGSRGGWIAARQAVDAGKPVVLLRPEGAGEFLQGVDIGPCRDEPPLSCAASFAAEQPWGRLLTLHAAHSMFASAGTVLVKGADGAPLWVWLPAGKSGFLLVGTDLARDLVRFRQGDPSVAANRNTDPLWGFAGERPNYLFDGQIDPMRPQERMADWWMWTMREALVRWAGVKANPVLPGGAAGAVIVTGDDDQAALSTYAEQATLLGDLPLTYFLHPLTKHDKASLAALSRGRRVELGLHPDALDAPGRYDALFDEQAAWFEGLVGEPPRIVRNHGFLNNGYWGHAAAWRRRKVLASSNLPGLDGRILNGSLLPARLALDGELTEHWSILTAIGDGVVFVHGWDDAQCAACVHALADAIRVSGVPGVIVLNLHPENVGKAQGLHDAALALVRDGFVAWTMSECIAWFSGGNERSGAFAEEGAADEPDSSPRAEVGQTNPARRLGWSGLKSKFGRMARGMGR